MSKEKPKKKEIRIDELLILVKYGVVTKPEASVIALRILNRLDNENNLIIHWVLELVDNEILSVNEIKDFYKNTLFT